MKVYCKNCKSYPRLGPLKALACCRRENIKSDWHSPRWYHRPCETKNMDNDCPDYERRK